VNADAPAGVVCPKCGERAGETDQFCESCGTALAVDPTAAELAGPAVLAPSAPAEDVRTALTEPPPEETAVRHCSCGGVIDDDGWCTVCGLRAPSERDHFELQPVPNVAGVCDRGMHHPRNEDALAIAASTTRAVLVVCDGVSNATDSDAAATAAANAACDALATAADPPSSVPSDRIDYWKEQCNAAAQIAQAAAVEAASHVGNVTEPPSCTFVTGIVDTPVVATAWIGDSRAYWFGDDGNATQLSTDDSWATDEIAHGVPRTAAEADPRAHSITRWLGVDSPGGDPSYTALIATGPGWVLVCSDGLWNYCSDAVALRDLVAATTAAQSGDPLASSRALVDWANEQGGHDNVTVALARVTLSNEA
jgi:serine/threonine protein phosphatase PrpC